jgi:hypothetical protein
MSRQPTTHIRSARLAKEIAKCEARAREVVAKAREALRQPCPDAFAGRRHCEPRSHAAARVRPASMRDMQAHLKTLRGKIAEFKRLERESRRNARRDVFKRLAAHYKVLADVLERAIAQCSKDQENKDQE